MGDGTAGGTLYTPSAAATSAAGNGSPHPGVIFLADAGGLRPSVRGAAARLAEAGYAVLAPNAFFRVGEPPFFTPPLDFQDPKVRATFGAIFSSLPPAAMESDGIRYAEFLDAQPETAEAPIAVVGHCMTGAMALRAAAACPERVGLAVSFHGGRLVTDSEDSPHHVLPRVRARLYFGHAERDQSMPAEAIAKLDQALETWGGTYESELYAGALHGWTTTDSPVFHKEQAERAFSKLVELLGG